MLNFGISIGDLSLNAMRRMCFQQADLGLELHGLIVDDDSRSKLAKALRRASSILERESHGVRQDGINERAPSSHPLDLARFGDKPTSSLSPSGMAAQ
jgi:hypothetical protein